MRRLERGRIFQFFEIVFIGGVMNVEFERLAFAALPALLPAARVFLVPVETADSEHRVIAITTVARVRKHHVFVRVVANPVFTTRSSRQFAGFSAQAASTLHRSPFLFLLHVSSKIRVPKF